VKIVNGMYIGVKGEVKDYHMRKLRYSKRKTYLRRIKLKSTFAGGGCRGECA
jgi:hypothetical protein